MALDNAQFISELSITDPPGTDPLSEGDDQIRTSKRAVFQSFPFVDAQVNLTAAQLNDAALKGAANVFTEINTFTLQTTFLGRLRAVNGSAGNPTYSFTDSTDAGMYWDPSDNLRFSVGGTERLRIAATGATWATFVTFATAGTLFSSFNNLIRKTGAGDIAGFTFQDTGSIARWLLGQSTDANSDNFVFQRRNSAGVVQDTPLVLNNLDNVVNMHNQDMQRITANDNTVIQWKNESGNVRHSLNYESNVGFNPNNLTFTAFTAGGAFISNPFRMLDGLLFMDSLPTVNPGQANALWRNPVSPGFIAIV